MADIVIHVRNKIAAAQEMQEIVCGNSDYSAVFDFDGDWEQYPLKTARFLWHDAQQNCDYCTDVVFEGCRAAIPAVYHTDCMRIGVYAGDIQTTTPAHVPCCRCVTDSQPHHPDPPADIYVQLLDELEHIRDNARASFEFILGTPVPLMRGFAGSLVGNTTEIGG